MRSAKHWLASLICLLLCASIVLAQDAQQPTAKASTDVTIIIGQEQVRFTAQRAVAEMRLQVFDPVGELVYDSGAIFAPELNWPLQNGNGQALKSGLYAYTLAVKEQGAAEAHVRRGHFILDRVADRASKTDRLWVTGQRETGVGAELTVVRSGQEVIAGTEIGTERTVGTDWSGINRNGDGRAADGRASEKASPDKVDAGKPVAASAAPTQTIGRIARFISATQVGNSVMTEVNDRIGLGTTTPEFRFDVAGNLRAAANVSNDLMVQTTGGTNSWARFLIKTNNAGWILGSSQNFAGDQFYLIDATDARSRLTIQPNGGAVAFPFGNFGIGTPNPQVKLHVQGTGFVEATIKSDNERAILSLANQLGPNAYTWSLESGYRGIPSLFGIHNRTVNKAAIEIDGSLLVTVNALQITGGADFAENFDVRAETASAIQPGMVVTIDPA